MQFLRRAGAFGWALAFAAVFLSLASWPFRENGIVAQDVPPPKTATGAEKGSEGRHLGGEPESIVQVANLVYAGIKSSHCFSDHFLIKAQKESAIATSRRFHAVKLGSDELFSFPLVIMTGEGSFQLPDRERENLSSFVAARRLPAGVGRLLLARMGPLLPPRDGPHLRANIR